MPAACEARRLMSSIDALSSCEAEATFSTLIEASPEAFSAIWTRELVWLETADKPAEVVLIWLEASFNWSSVWRTRLSNSPT
jgi:hypothetical protein